jgi:hypothetical protein
MSKSNFLFILFISLIIFPTILFAEVPKMMNYQGILTDSKGVIVPDGKYKIVFRIYSTKTGGNPLWEEEREVEVKSGLFNLLLGEVNPLSQDIFKEANRYLSLEIDGKELLPRQKIVTVAYSFISAKAEDADKLEGKKASDFASSSHIHDKDTILPDILSSIDGVSNDGGDIDLVAGDNIKITSDDTNNKITISATSGTGDCKWSESGGNVYRTSGNVGIGTTEPEAKLDVEGNIHANGAIKSGNSIEIQGTSNNRNTIYYEDDNHGLPSDWNLWFRGGKEDNPGESYILFQNGLYQRDKGVAITMNEFRNHNKLWISAYDKFYGNLIYTEDPTEGGGQGFGIAGGSHMAPFDRFVVNSDEMFLGYCLRPGDGTNDSGGDGKGNLYVRGNVGIGTTDPHSTLHIDGSMARSIKVITTDYTITDSDNIIVTNPSDGIDVYLPSAVGIAGRVYTIKEISGQDIHIYPYPGELIDNASSYYFYTGGAHQQWDYVTIVSDGQNWLIIGEGK